MLASVCALELAAALAERLRLRLRHTDGPPVALERLAIFFTEHGPANFADAMRARLVARSPRPK